MIGQILSWLAGGGIAAIGKEIRQAQKDRLDAANASERIALDERLAFLDARRAVLLAEQNSRLTSWIRPAFAFPFVAYLWKLVIWDKILGFGATDPLSPQLAEIMMVIIGAYFLTRPFEKIWRR